MEAVEKDVDNFEQYMAGGGGSHKGIIFIPPLNEGLYPIEQGIISGETKLEVVDIKIWLEHKNFKPEFFFPKSMKSLEDDESSKPEYQTFLMSILYKTIQRYYGENFDPNDSDTNTTQKDIIDWLMKTFSLSKRQAEAIDIITRPKQLK